MKQRLPVFATLAACLASIVAAGLAFVVVARDRPDVRVDQDRAEEEGKMPPAVARHMKRFESLPGFQGMSAEGPGSLGDERFLARAYPDDDIPLLRIEAARAAAASLKAKDFPSGKGQPDTWVSVGPSNALYPSRSSAPRSATFRIRTLPADARPPSRSIPPARRVIVASGCLPPAVVCGGPRMR